MEDWLSKQGTGSTFTAIDKKTLSDLSAILAPFNEQRRIVEKLDKLLAKVESAKARLERVPAILKRFRQAVLAAAVSGELTKDWRERNGQTSKDWHNVSFGKVAEHRLGKMLDKAKNTGKPTQYLRNVNVRWFEFDLTDLSFMRATEKDKKELSIQNGDLLVCEGGEPGRCAVWQNGETDLIFQKAIHRIRPSEQLDPWWIALNIRHDAE
ncbi:MAG: restriction endonuclease subunit S, partial [bacterium]